MSNYGCQQILISPDKDLKAILEFVCGESAKLSNCGTYYARQLFFKTSKIPSKFDLHKLLSSNPHFQAMHSQVAQQCLTTVAESFKSYIGLLEGMKTGTVTQKPKFPGYRQGGLCLITFPSQAVKLKPEGLRFPLGSKVKVWFGLDAFYLPMPTNIDCKKIKEYRILPRNGAFYLELIYKVEVEKVAKVSTGILPGGAFRVLDKSKVLGIDHGLNNWLTCVSNIGTSFIVDGFILNL